MLAYWLILELCFRDAKSANLVLQRCSLQSQSLGGSALACDSSRSGSQSIDDHRGFRLPKCRGCSNRNLDFGGSRKFVNRHLQLMTPCENDCTFDEVG